MNGAPPVVRWDRSPDRAPEGAPPRGVLFDFGGTLAVLSPTREEIFQRAARSVGVEVEPAAIRMAYWIVEFHKPYSSVLIRTAEQRADFYSEFNHLLCDVLGISLRRDALVEAVTRAFRASRTWVAATGAKRAMRRLAAAGIPHGIVSNWDQDLAVTMAGLGLSTPRDVVVCSQEAGVEKPDARIFHMGLQSLGLQAARAEGVTYVGDDYRLDVLGARAAGLAPVLIDRDGRYPAADCPRYASLDEWIDAHVPGG